MKPGALIQVKSSPFLLSPAACVRQHSYATDDEKAAAVTPRLAGQSMVPRRLPRPCRIGCGSAGFSPQAGLVVDGGRAEAGCYDSTLYAARPKAPAVVMHAWASAASSRAISLAGSLTSGGRTTARFKRPSSTSASFIRLCMSRKGGA